MVIRAQRILVVSQGDFNIFQLFFMKCDNIFVYNIMHFNNNTHMIHLTEHLGVVWE